MDDQFLATDEVQISIFRLPDFFTVSGNTEWCNCLTFNIPEIQSLESPQLTPLFIIWKRFCFYFVGFLLYLMESWAQKQDVHKDWAAQWYKEVRSSKKLQSIQYLSRGWFSVWYSRQPNVNTELWSVSLLARSSHYARVCITEHLITVFWLEPAFSFQPSRKVTE